MIYAKLHEHSMSYQGVSVIVGCSDVAFTIYNVAADTTQFGLNATYTFVPSYIRQQKQGHTEASAAALTQCVK